MNFEKLTDYLENIDKNYVPECEIVVSQNNERVYYHYTKRDDVPYEPEKNKYKMIDAIDWMNKKNGFCMLEVCCDTKQFFEPKSATKRLEDGSLYSPPLEDLAPFLDREELRSNMYLPLWDER